MLAKEPGSAPVSVTDSSEETKKPVTTNQLQETSKIKFDDLSCQKKIKNKFNRHKQIPQVNKQIL
jgi:hypothetical protein